MSIDSLRDARVLITGGYGFLGEHLSRLLMNKYRAFVFIPCRYEQVGKVDLTRPDHVEGVFQNLIRWNNSVDYVFHLAGYNGGIQFNLDNPADIFLRNTLMGLNVLDACQRYKVKKVVSVVASCAYPEFEWFLGDGYDENTHFQAPREIMMEHDFLNGPTHPSVSCHGYAKRNLQIASSFYRQQYGLNAVCACPTTLYGPGDSFDPQRTKVMGAMIKRFVDAVESGEQEVVCWGSGKAKREFLYVEDAAELLVQTMRHYEDSNLPLNLGTGQELSIKEVAETVAKCVKFSGNISWDTSKPDGQLRKRLDLTRMRQCLPGVELTPLETGIGRTAEFYRSLKVAA